MGAVQRVHKFCADEPHVVKQPPPLLNTCYTIEIFCAFTIGSDKEEILYMDSWWTDCRHEL